MIAQVLNRDFVLDQFEDIKSYLRSAASGTGDRRSEEDEFDLSPTDYGDALAHLESAETREQQISSGQSNYEMPLSERRGEAAAPLDDFSFFSRDAIVSNVQSALEETLEERLQSVEEGDLPDDGRRGGEEIAVTDRTIRGFEPRREGAGRRLFDKFSITDIRWVSCKFAEGVTLFRGKRGFVDNPREPAVLDSNRMRVLLVGDWGSGLPRAIKVAKAMRLVLDEGKQKRIPQAVVHLGDVYYSGWKREYKKHIFSHWPVQSGEAGEIASYSLNANHDMFSGGHAYFGDMLEESRFKKWHGGCSYFSFHNNDWEILGIDTAWEDDALKDPQAEWVQQRAAASGRKIVLLSHHQLFSAFEKSGTMIGDKLRGVLNSGRLHSWFWGHEHRCVTYGGDRGLKYAACLGHGGVPVYMTHQETDDYPPPAVYEYRKFFEKGLERWALFGFAVLDFEDDHAVVRYIDEDGIEHKTEALP